MSIYVYNFIYVVFLLIPYRAGKGAGGYLARHFLGQAWPHSPDIVHNIWRWLPGPNRCKEQHSVHVVQKASRGF